MGLSFRKSIKLGAGLRLNLSKSGIGLSAGVRGARISFGPRGTQLSMGTGPFRYTTRVSARKRTKSGTTQIMPNNRNELLPRPSYGFIWLIVIGTIYSPTLPVLGIFMLALGIAVWRIFPKHRAFRAYKKGISSSEPSEKLKALREAHRILPSPAYTYELACALYDAEHFEEAAPFLQDLSLRIPLPALILMAAQTSILAKQPTSAIELLEKIDEPEESDLYVEARFIKASAYKSLHEYDRALDLLKSVLACRNESATSVKRKARLLRGQVFLETNRTREAKKDFMDLITDSPTSVEAEKARQLMEGVKNAA